MIPSATEFSVLIGVGGWVNPSSWSVMHRVAAFYPFWNSPPTSTLAADSNMCLSMIHSVWIGTFSGGMRFGAFSGRLVVVSGNSALLAAACPWL